MPGSYEAWEGGRGRGRGGGGGGFRRGGEGAGEVATAGVRREQHGLRPSTSFPLLAAQPLCIITTSKLSEFIMFELRVQNTHLL